MIIKGLILTDNGPMDIKDLKAEDKALNQLHRAFAVGAIKKKKVRGAYTFSKNPSLVVAKGTIIKTVYGDKKVEDLVHTYFYAAQPNMRMVRDKALKITGEYTAYNIGGSDAIFASNYCLKMEGKNA